MTDIELLKLAAKAAQINYDAEKSAPHPVNGCFWGLWLVYDREPTEYDRRTWNPLRDDGDALRLAVITRQRVTVPRAFGFGACAEPQDGGSAGVTVFRGYELADVMSQTRRAIVMCAANMAKDMP